MQPQVDFKPVDGAPNPLSLSNLDQLNAKGGTNVYLTSVDDVTKNPPWLTGVKPDASGKTNGATTSVVVVNTHADGIVDAFYFYFYSFNLGNKVLGQNLGNVSEFGVFFSLLETLPQILLENSNANSDCQCSMLATGKKMLRANCCIFLLTLFREHVMVRFKNGLPTSLWYSQHEYGEAFTYQAVEKQGARPVAYSATGSHANYATAGTHDHTIPGVNLPVGPLEDHTDKGTLWDPILSAYFFSYDGNSKAFTAYDNSAPTNFLKFVGRWGDRKYPDGDSRQKKFFNIDATAKYVDGPTGPEDKQLVRRNVCPDKQGFICVVRPILGP